MRKVQTGPHSHKWVKEPMDYVYDVISDIGLIIELAFEFFWRPFFHFMAGMTVGIWICWFYLVSRY